MRLIPCAATTLRGPEKRCEYNPHECDSRNIESVMMRGGRGSCPQSTVYNGRASCAHDGSQNHDPDGQVSAEFNMLEKAASANWRALCSRSGCSASSGSLLPARRSIRRAGHLLTTESLP
jgi:hypothetical protein